MTNKVLWVCTLGLCLWVTSIASAQDTNGGDMRGTLPEVRDTMTQSQLKPHLGIMAGMSNPEASYDAALEVGVDLGFQAWTPFGVGVEVSHLSSRRDSAFGDRNLDRTNILAKGLYNFGGTQPVLRYSYVGLGLGGVIDATGYQGTHTGVAPLAGFDIPLGPRNTDEAAFSLGLGTKYVFVGGPSPDYFAINGLVKYWWH